MRSKFPRTYDYFAQFKPQLEVRSLHRRWGHSNPFYAMYDIGPYTFAPWKVAWKRSTRNFEAAVVGSLPVTPERTAVVVPNGKVMILPFEDELEAHYVCAVLNSSLTRARINSALTSEAHAEMLDLIQLDGYVASDSNHRELADLSRTCHIAQVEGRIDTQLNAEMQLDQLVAGMWGVTADDVYRAQQLVAPELSIYVTNFT